MLYTMRTLGDDVGAARELLDALTHWTEWLDVPLRSRDISWALFGLQGMSDCAPIRNILTRLAPRIEQSTEVFNSKEASMALVGFQSMSDESTEVADVLRALIPKIVGGTGAFDAFMAAQVFQGLWDHKSAVASQLRDFVIERLQLPIVDANTNLRTDEGQGSAIITLASAMLMQRRPLPEPLEHAYNWLLEKEERECARMSPADRSANMFERLTLEPLIKLCEPDIPIKTHTHCVDGLKMHLYFPEQKLNIQYDGNKPKCSASRVFQQRRDDYLRNVKGIRVLRIDFYGQHTPDENVRLIGQLVSRLL
jgi:hypothetical protein